MREQKRISVADIDPDPEQPRKLFDDAELLALGQNMLAVGQLVPIIVYWVVDLKRWVIADGERRFRSAVLVGLKELIAICLLDRPTPAQLGLERGAIEFHKSAWSAMERSDFLHRLRQEHGWTVKELAANLHIKQPLASNLLGLQRLFPGARKALHDSVIDIQRAIVIAQAPDEAKQLELLDAAKTCSREGLRRKVRCIVSEPKVPAATFVMPGQVSVSVKATDLTLTHAVDILSETIRILKKSQSQGLDISTVQRVCKDTAKAGAK